MRRGAVTAIVVGVVLAALGSGPAPGGANPEGPASARLMDAAHQPIPTARETQVVFSAGSTSWDDGGFVAKDGDPGFTLPFGSKYALHATVEFGRSAEGVRYVGLIDDTDFGFGGLLGQIGPLHATNAVDARRTVIEATWEVAVDDPQGVGDRLYLVVYQDSGRSLNLLERSLYVERIAAI